MIQGSSGNDALRAFGELLDQRNRHYFDDLKAQGEAAVAAGKPTKAARTAAATDSRGIQPSAVAASLL